jgi:hypothetical protein
MPKGYLNKRQVMRRLECGHELVKSLARKHGWQMERLGKRDYYREADIVLYETRLRYPSPKPEPQPKQPVFGRRRGAGSRTWGD